MTARNSMTHRCQIDRNAALEGAPDPYGSPATPQWALLTTGVPCRWWFEGTRTVLDGGSQKEVSRRKLIVPLETDVTEDDRVAWVHDQRGRELADGPMRIDSVGRRADHKVLTMVEVQ